MRKTYGRRVALAVIMMLILAACGGDGGTTTTAGSEPTETTGAEATPTTEAMAPSTTEAEEVDETTPDEEASGEMPGYGSWDEVLAAAEGTTVNWYMWGGDDTLNMNVDEYIGGPLLDEFGVTLNRVPVNDTADAVNQVLNEASAGVETDGTVDLIWINGENFRTLREADLLYGPWAESLPNAQYVPWGDPAVDFDFGTPVEGYESPWGSAQFVFHYNTELAPEAPTTFEDLQEWVHANPGLFTYPAIPDFVGSVFVRHVFYWVAGGPDPFLEEFDQATFDEYAPTVWEYLNDLEPDLWRGGETYPESAVMNDLIANQEIAFNMGYSPGEPSLKIADGSYPETIRSFVMDTGTLANNSYVGIPFNAPNPAGAMVLANYIVSPEYQLVLTDPDIWAWETPTDPATWPDDARAALDAYERGVATLGSEELVSHALPEPRADWVTAMEEGWIENVLEQ